MTRGSAEFSAQMQRQTTRGPGAERLVQLLRPTAKGRQCLT
jgi:hypothetical protein